MWVIASLVVLALIILLVGAIVRRRAQPAFVATTVPAVDAADHLRRGDAASPVSVIEYADFECPACLGWQPVVEELATLFGDRAAFVFRNFPLQRSHPNATIAAQAAEAAGLEGKYWEMHDLLYKSQAEWVNAPKPEVAAQSFARYAQSLGLDVAKFNADIVSPQVVARVQRDIDSARAAQVRYTPTFFVNLKQIENPSDLPRFVQLIEEALSDADSSPTNLGVEL